MDTSSDRSFPPAGAGATLNPFAVVDGAAALVDFVVAVFGGTEVAQARTSMPDGRLIHAEVTVGTAHLLRADRLAGWPAHPALLQIWVTDVAAVLTAAVARGARVVTPATPFYGETTLGRMADPWGNLWWLYAPAPGQADPRPVWEGGDDTVFRTLDVEMRGRQSLSAG